MILPDKASSFEGLGRGGFTTNGIAVLYDIDGYGWHHDTLALGAHEGWHQYVQTTFKDLMRRRLMQQRARIFCNW